jgi:plasmid stabilization system protein ParE
MGESKEKAWLEIMSIDERWTVSLSINAKRDLDEIGTYIEEVTLEPDIADRQVARIKKAIDSLDFMPYRFRLHYDEPWHSQGLRMMVVDKYIVYYRPDEAQKTVIITRVIHSARDINKVLGEPEQAEE